MSAYCSFSFFFFFKQKTAYELMPSLVGSEMCIRDRFLTLPGAAQLLALDAPIRGWRRPTRAVAKFLSFATCGAVSAHSGHPAASASASKADFSQLALVGGSGCRADVRYLSRFAPITLGDSAKFMLLARPIPVCGLSSYSPPCQSGGG